jgi:hypothetical protein
MNGAVFVSTEAQLDQIWQTRPALVRLHRALELVRRRTLPQGLPGQTIDYALKRSSALTQFVEDGTLEIHDNLIKNAIRPSALGKRNFLFIGLPEAGERSAVIYTLLGSCQRHGLNPFDCLKDLFTRLPVAKITEIKAFTPAAWAKGKAKEIRLKEPAQSGRAALVGRAQRHRNKVATCWSMSPFQA